MISTLLPLSCISDSDERCNKTCKHSCLNVGNLNNNLEVVQCCGSIVDLVHAFVLEKVTHVLGLFLAGREQLPEGPGSWYAGGDFRLKS